MIVTQPVKERHGAIGGGAGRGSDRYSGRQSVSLARSLTLRASAAPILNAASNASSVAMPQPPSAAAGALLHRLRACSVCISLFPVQQQQLQMSLPRFRCGAFGGA